MKLAAQTWAGATIEFEKHDDERVTGTLRAVRVCFERDNADLDFRFDAVAASGSDEARATQGSMHELTVHDMRCLEHVEAHGTKRYVLERAHTKPYGIRATWRANELGVSRQALLSHDGDQEKRGTI